MPYSTSLLEDNLEEELGESDFEENEYQTRAMKKLWRGWRSNWIESVVVTSERSRKD